jgi:hypothetical protein
VRWNPDGTSLLLGQLPGQPTNTTVANSVNEAAQAVGYATRGSGSVARRAVRWAVNGTPTVLDEIPGWNANRTEAYDINEAAQAVGYTVPSNSQYSFAVRWNADGSVALLGDLPGQTTLSSTAYGIIDGGYACGEIATYLIDGYYLGNTAVIWDADGKPTALQDLISDGNKWEFSQARGIDRDGDMIRLVATGSKNGERGGYWLLTATIPEPAAGTTILFSAATAAVMRRRG